MSTVRINDYIYGAQEFLLPKMSQSVIAIPVT